MTAKRKTAASATVLLKNNLIEIKDFLWSEKGKKIQPTDFIEHVAADERSSGQGIIFGTKPLEILIPYIKVLTKRGDLIVEPFGGSGSTLIAATKMKRRCYLMEKSPVYAEVIKHRWEKLTGKEVKRIL